VTNPPLLSADGKASERSDALEHLLAAIARDRLRFPIKQSRKVGEPVFLEPADLDLDNRFHDRRVVIVVASLHKSRQVTPAD
jgi:hypothetical protein